MTGAFKTHDGRKVTIAGKLGEGGEGVVYEIHGDSSRVAKVYFPPKRSRELESKLQVMVRTPPRDRSRGSGLGHVSIAWPEALLYDGRAFVGYVMPKISGAHDLFVAYHPKTRAAQLPGFSTKHLLHVARNIAVALADLHQAGYVMGDVNQKNVLVSPSTLVTLVDTDSFQVPKPRGGFYRCQVGIEEFTPPELQGRRLADVDRAPVHDAFGLGVAVFLLMMEGFHPFGGRALNPALSIGRVEIHCIRNGIFPYVQNQQFSRPPAAPPFDSLHPMVRDLMLRCFVDGDRHPSRRPVAREWITALEAAEKDLVKCRQDPTHMHASHLSSCPWCQKAHRRPAPRRPPAPRPYLPPSPRPAPPAHNVVPYHHVSPTTLKTRGERARRIALAVCAVLAMGLAAFGLAGAFADESAPVEHPQPTTPTSPATSPAKPIQPPTKSPSAEEQHSHRERGGSSSAAVRRGRQILKQGGSYQAAVEYFEQAVRRNPGNAWAHCELSSAYNHLDRYAEGEASARNAIYAGGGASLMGAAYYNLGRSYEGRGRTAEAISAYEAALRERPRNRFVRRKLLQIRGY